MSTTLDGPIYRPAFAVHVDACGLSIGRVLEARNLDQLADLIQDLLRPHTSEHVGVRLDIEGTVWVRLGFAPSFAAGAWTAAGR